MATITQVLETMGQLVQGYVYPHGTNQPSIIGTDINIVAGWPIKNDLDSMLASGVSVISVFSNNDERSMNRFAPVWMSGPTPQSTLTYVSKGNTVTFSGSAQAGCTIYVSIGSDQYTYTMSGTETLAQLAQYFAAQTAGSSSGASFTAPNAINIVVRIAVKSTQYKEVKRQKLSISVIIWASTWEVRDQIAQVLEPQLGDLSRFVLPDNFYAVIMHGKNIILDKYELKDIYRQDLVYYVEYPSTLEKDAYSITESQIILATPESNFLVECAESIIVDNLSSGVFTTILSNFVCSCDVEDTYSLKITSSNAVQLLIAENQNLSSSYGTGISKSIRSDLTISEVQAVIRSMYVRSYANGSLVIEIDGKNTKGTSKVLITVL